MKRENITNLTDDFILELFHIALKKREVFEILFQHLKYSYLVTEQQKKFWKKAVQLFKLKNRTPSLGLLQVEFRKDDDMLDFILDVKEATVFDKDGLIEEFQNFIKESKFVEIFENASELYNRGKEKQAIETFMKGADEMNSFSIKDKIFKKVFKGFEDRNIDRQIQEYRTKIPFFIDEVDKVTFGGAETGETVLVLAESGIGKTQWLYHQAINTARFGYDAIIFSIEGTEKQALDRLDAAWTGVLYRDMKKGLVDEERMMKLENIIKNVRGEVYLEAFEKFGSVTDVEIRQAVIDAKKMYPNLKAVLIDYLELMTVADGINYSPRDERFRQQKIGRFMKELAMEQDVVVYTVTQASNLPSELKRNPEFVMTREFLSEDKGKIRPFDYFATLNQTYDEREILLEDGTEISLLRWYWDKIREYKSGQVIPIVTSFKNARFYDRRKTLEYLLDIEDE